MKIFKKIVGIAVNVLIVLIFVISIFVIIATASQKDGVPNLFGLTFASVQSDSMTGTFEKGDLVVGRLVDENTEIKEGEIISLYQIDSKTNIQFINTHRVVRIEGDTTKWYYTKGDKEGYDVDPDARTINQIIAVYQFHIPAVGGFVDFMREPLGFILIVVLPIALVIVWEVYRIIMLLVERKKAQAEEAGQEITEPSEEMKSAIIQEYLKSLENGQGAPDKDTENNKD